MTRSSIGRRRALAVGAAALSLVAPCPDARAQQAAGIDVGAVEQGERGQWAPAVDARFGTRFGPPRGWIIHTVIFQPEVRMGYLRLPPLSADASALRLGGGLRIGGLIGPVEPFAYGHANAFFVPGEAGSQFDFGLAVDWRFTGSSLGLHWNHDWVTIPGASPILNELGVHFEVRGFWLDSRPGD